MIIIRVNAVEEEVRCVMRDGARGAKVEKMGGGVESFGPKGRRGRFRPWRGEEGGALGSDTKQNGENVVIALHVERLHSYSTETHIVRS
jgi:hypothetical protein